MTARLTDAELDELLTELSKWRISIFRDSAKQAADAIRALRQERRPREPTQEMCKAGWDAAFGKYADDSKRNVTVIWRAMYDAAAPSEGDHD